jgi:outer membrane lipoprotein carrier protein
MKKSAEAQRACSAGIFDRRSKIASIGSKIGIQLYRPTRACTTIATILTVIFLHSPTARAASPSPSPTVSSSPSPTQSPAHAQKSEKGLPALLKEVESLYAKGGTLSAHFDQTNESSALNTKKKSSGHIEIQRPDKVRWETTEPDPNLLVSDGKHAWYYTPPFDASEHGQYSQYPASAIQSRLANSLLSGEFSANKDLKIKTLSESRFALLPKIGTAGTVTEARVEIDSDKKTITRVELFYKDGNHSDIRLSDIKLGEKFDSTRFVFKVPPNADRIQE